MGNYEICDCKDIFNEETLEGNLDKTSQGNKIENKEENNKNDKKNPSFKSRQNNMNAFKEKINRQNFENNASGITDISANTNVRLSFGDENAKDNQNEDNKLRSKKVVLKKSANEEDKNNGSNNEEEEHLPSKPNEEIEENKTNLRNKHKKETNPLKVSSEISDLKSSIIRSEKFNQSMGSLTVSADRSFGKLIYLDQSSNQVTYIGELLNETKDGFGKQIWNEKDFYLGYFKNDRREGLGKFSIQDIYCEGEFVNDNLNGFGIYTNEKGAVFEGTWDNNLQQDVGSVIWKDNSHYEGEYKDGKKHGIGTYRWPSGEIYEGEWKNNLLDGLGIYYFTNGRVYRGYWKNCLKNGYGEYEIIGKGIYMGNYVNDKKDGFGMYLFREELKVYMGFWKDGKMNGIGKFLTKNKVEYGIWSKGNKVSHLKENEVKANLEKSGYQNYYIFFTKTLDDILEYVKQSESKDDSKEKKE